MEILTHTSQETAELAGAIAKKLNVGDVLALSGDLGSGKTFFTTHLTKALNINTRVQSPTFVLVREYADKSLSQPIKKIYHIDLYRLESEPEVLDLGLDSFFEDPDAVTVIEWPEVANNLLPQSTIFINFESVNETARRIHVHNLR